MGFTEIYERIKLAANCRTQVELAELLNIQVFLDGPQQGYVLRAQSPDYPETSLDAALLQRRMLGRVVWTFQEV